MKTSSVHILQDLALNDHLRRGIAVRFQQYRVHVAMCIKPTGLCLYRLRSADLAAIDGDGAIQGHVLRFERCYPKSLAQKNTAQADDQRAFARIRGAALDH